MSRREPSSSIQCLQFEMGPTRQVHQSSLLLLIEQRLALHFKRVSTWLCCRPRLAHDSVDLWIYGGGVLPKNKPWCQQFPKQLNFLSLSLSHGTFCGSLKYLGSNQMSWLCIILEGAANYSVVDGPVQELLRTSAMHFLWHLKWGHLLFSH